MKKSYIYQMAALLSLSLVACSENEMNSSADTNRFGEQEIGFLPTTTRADIDDLQSGFTVYATKGESPTEYMISGGTYLYSASAWGWDGETTYSWPDSASDYPVNFYAFYLTDAYSVTDTDVTTLETDVTVLEAGSQVDILSATQEATARPVGGKLSLEFEHIMTCVNLTITATESSLLHIQSVKFVGADDTNTYDFLSSAWDTTTSIYDTTPSYDYLVTSDPAQIIISSSSTTEIEDSATDIVSTYGSLYLMPQTLSPWDLSTTLADARVEIIFRSTAVVEDATSSDTQIGYVEAQDHPDYTDSSSVAADSPLFIRIAYPLTSSTTTDSDDYTWVDSYSYNYAVTLGHDGVTNGYFASEYYYDEDGNETEFEIDNAEVGDEVTPGDIHFTPSVVDWVSASNTAFN